MSTLLLIRHGQARAFEADSDRLTERGEEQARVVGRELSRSGLVVDEVFSGTLTRQRATRDLVGEAYRAAGLAWPEPREHEGWNEYDSGGILGTLLPELAKVDENFRAAVADFEAALGRPDRNRFFQRMFERVIGAWQRGDLEHPAVESFKAFHARVCDGFSAVTREGGKRTVVVFTSGGPIGVCVQRVLDAPPATAMLLNSRVKNASISEFVFSEGRISLDSFNGVEHLPPELRTFR